MPDRLELGLGTDPLDPLLPPRIAGLYREPAGSAVTLMFQARSNRSYTVQFTNALGTGSWTKLADVPARATNRIEVIPDPGYATNRFYRVNAEDFFSGLYAPPGTLAHGNAVIGQPARDAKRYFGLRLNYFFE